MKRLAVIVVGVVVVVLWPREQNVVAAEPSATETGEWGAELRGLRTRLVPLEKKFVLGRPIKFRLEMKNFGRHVARYDAQAVDVNGSLHIHDSRGRDVPFIGPCVQTSGDIQVLAPGKTTVLFNGFDVEWQYLFVKPGKYTVQFWSFGGEVLAKAKKASHAVDGDAKAEEGVNGGFWLRGAIPLSNTVEIDVQPGAVSPARRAAARLFDVLPKKWGMSVCDSSHAIGEDGQDELAPPGWEAASDVSSIRLQFGSGIGEDMDIFISGHRLFWTGKVVGPGTTAVACWGKCPEGFVYGPWRVNDRFAWHEWLAIEESIEQSLRIVPDEHPALDVCVKEDGDLKINPYMASELRHVSLGGTKLADLGMKRLKNLPRLKEVWLCKTRLTDAGMEPLEGLSQLQFLALDDTKITDAGLEHLKGLARLGHLSLDNDRITDAGLDSLVVLPRLKTLRLNNTQITDRGLEKLSRMTQLRGLALDGVKITDAGLQHLKAMPHLKWLFLENTPLTDACLEHLTDLTQLKTLRLAGTHVTDRGVEKLERALPNCKVVR